MMNQAVSIPLMVRSLDLAVVETLETMFFADAFHTAEADLHWDTSVCSVVVHFTGDAEGSLQLRVSEGSATELAANFLGLDPLEVTRIQLESVCGEMANMICGVMVSIAFPEGTFMLRPPETLGCPESFPRSAVVRSYQMQSDTLEVRLSCAGANAFPEC